MMAHPPLPALDAAQRLTARGWVVFPADRPDSGLHCSGSARACRERRCGAESDASKRGKHPAVVSRWGELSAPAAPEQLIEWFAPTDSGQARYNVAVACGPSGLLVVDDDAAGGFERAAEALDGKLPETFRVRSSARGWHWWWTVPLDEHGVRVPVGNAPGLLAPFGCDVRGGASPSHPHGGYVIGPGSQHWTDDPDAYLPADWDAPACAAPEWLITAVTTPGPSGRTEGMPGRTGTAGAGTGHGPGLTRWDSAPRYGSAADLAAQFARHCAEVTEPGNAFRWGLFLAARDGWRLVALGLLDEDTMQRDLAAVVWRVWAAEPDERDVKIVMWEALDGPHGAIASPWQLSGPEQIEHARAAGSRPVGRFTRPGDAVSDPAVIEPGIESISDGGAVTSDNGAPDHTTYGNLAVAPRDIPSVDLSSAEALAEPPDAPPGIDRDAWRREYIRQTAATAVREHIARQGIEPMTADTIDEFLDGEGHTYLVPRMFYRDGLAVLFGAPGAAKSFLALDICLSLTSGRAWALAGTTIPTYITGRDGGPGIAHYVMAEGVKTNRGRTRAWLHHHGVSREAIRERFLPFTKYIIELSAVGVAEYLTIVEKDKPDIVFLDTKNLMFVGRESQGEDYGAMLRVLHAIRRAAGGCAVVLIDHSGLGDQTRTRGGNAQKGGIETEIMVTDKEGVRLVENTRDKSGVEGSRVWCFRLHQIEELRTSGDEDPPAVLVPVTEDEHRPVKIEGDWWDDDTPVPDDVIAIKGNGRQLAILIYRILRWVGGAHGLAVADVKSAIDAGTAAGARMKYDRTKTKAALTVLTDAGIVEHAAGSSARWVLTPEYAGPEAEKTLG